MSLQPSNRREQIRAQTVWNGLDYLEVETDHPAYPGLFVLKVYFLNKLEYLEPVKANVRVTGGRQRVTLQHVEAHRVDAADTDDWLEVVLDVPGPKDGTYRLELLEHDEFDQPTDTPLKDLDPRYAVLEFSLRPDRSADLDCVSVIPSPPEVFAEPVINYLAKDYASFRQALFDRLALVMPEWRERHVPDVGVALIEILAYVGDHLSYYQDAVSTEAYLATARQRISVRRHARLIDYTMHEGCNARALVQVQVSAATLPLNAKTMKFFAGLHGSAKSVVLDKDLRKFRSDQSEIYEPVLEVLGQETITFYQAHNTISFYTWGGEVSRLHRGATKATLKDGATGQNEILRLEVGDVLIFQERVGPHTGNPADADPRKRHAVRLSKVTSSKDALFDQAVLEIEWCQDDALPFDLCLSTRTDAPACKDITDVSVALGNIVLVDHGRTICVDIGEVPTDHVPTDCDDCGCNDTDVLVAGRFRPTLEGAPLTFAEAIPKDKCLSAWFKRDPRLALPALQLTHPKQAEPDQNQAPAWLPRRDLLSSGPNDPHVVVEMDNDGLAHLRFGDGELGAQPKAGQRFQACYRIGNGPQGNVPREAIKHLLLEGQTVSDGISGICNPMPAWGGTAAESIEEVKRYAPFAIQQRLKRAITTEDYARLASELFPNEVARAAASLRWTGTHREVLLAIDARGRSEASPELLKQIAETLESYRRIGHLLRVVAAQNVPLDLGLSIRVQPGYIQGHVKVAVLECLSNRTLTNGELGFFHPDRLSFGEGVFVSRIIATVRAVQGVENVTVTRLMRFGQIPDDTALLRGVLTLNALEVARLDNDASRPELGVLKIKMEGGR
jgi:hypothetical protein